ncbi:MAG: hypothetical protein AAGG01_22115, partial [Planctomycetota bacterium]
VSVRVKSDSISPLDLSVNAFRADGNGQLGSGLGWSIASDTFRGFLEEGSWILRVHRGSYYGLPLATLDPIQVKAGSQPIRLADVDLTGKTRVISVRFEDERGQPVPSVDLDLEDRTSGATGTVSLDGEETLTLPAGPVSIRAQARSHFGDGLKPAEWVSTGTGSEIITFVR